MWLTLEMIKERQDVWLTRRCSVMAHSMPSELFSSLTDSVILPFLSFSLGLKAGRDQTPEHTGLRGAPSVGQRTGPGPQREGRRGHGGRGAASPTSRPSPRAFRAAVGAAPEPRPQGPRPSPPSLPGSSSGSSSGSSCVGPRASPGCLCRARGAQVGAGAGAVLAAMTAGFGGALAREALDVLPGRGEDARAARDGLRGWGCCPCGFAYGAASPPSAAQKCVRAVLASFLRKIAVSGFIIQPFWQSPVPSVNNLNLVASYVKHLTSPLVSFHI